MSARRRSTARCCARTPSRFQATSCVTPCVAKNSVMVRSVSARRDSPLRTTKSTTWYVGRGSSMPSVVSAWASSAAMSWLNVWSRRRSRDSSQSTPTASSPGFHLRVASVPQMLARPWAAKGVVLVAMPSSMSSSSHSRNRRSCGVSLATALKSMQRSWLDTSPMSLPTSFPLTAPLRATISGAGARPTAASAQPAMARSGSANSAARARKASPRAAHVSLSFTRVLPSAQAESAMCFGSMRGRRAARSGSSRQTAGA
mmetsp:Transcript_51096/g.143874  ORF Transcript_51096/g.143874 Transcript_51096/m.143874 type:complete len:258 (-) Transcript_51096:309-1082(-)